VRFGVFMIVTIRIVLCLGCDAVWLGRSVWTFQRIVLPPTLGYIIMMVKAAGTSQM